MIMIHESKDYVKFESFASNRKIVKTRALEYSMTKYGFLSAFPLFVEKAGASKFKIKDGHHRFYVARKLNIPVKYVIDDSKITIPEINLPVNVWTLPNHLEHYINEGYPEYLKVHKYCEETGIAVHAAISMLGGHAAGSGNFSNSFKSGAFKINTKCDHAQKVADLILYIKKIGIGYYNTSPMVCAISKMFWVDTFDPNHMKKKIKSHLHLMSKQATIEQYLDMLENVYNYASKTRLPLKFMAADAANKRNAIPKQR